MVRQSISICGCGWLGLPLAKALVESGYSVKGSTTSPEKIPVLKDAGIFSFYLQVSSQGLVGESVEEFLGSPIIVLTIPFSRHYSGEDNLALMEVVIRRIEQIRRTQWVIYTSSTSVYPQDAGMVTEDTVFTPDPGRAQALLQIEQLVLSSQVFAGAVVRLGGLYGGDRRLGKYLAGAKGLTGGEQPVNLIHQDDAVGILKSVIMQERRGCLFNACADTHPTRRELYTLAARKQGLAEPEFQVDHSRGKIVSSAKARQVLGYSFLHPDPLLDVEFG